MTYLQAAESMMQDSRAEDEKATYHQRWQKEKRDSDLIKILEILILEKDYDQAFKIIKTLPIEIFKNKRICLQCSEILRKKGNHKESIKILELSLNKYGNDEAIQIELARNYLGEQKFENTIRILEKIETNESNGFSIWFNLGVAYSNLGKLKQGLNAFTKANELKPDDEVTAANLITLLKETKQVNKAREVIDDLPKTIDKKRAEILGAEAGVLMAEQRFGEAALILRDLCEKDPLQSSNWLNYVACIKANKVTVDPDSILRTALKLNPKNSSLQHAWLQSLCDIGKQKQAKSLLSQLPIQEFLKKDIHLFNLLFLSTSQQLLPNEKLKTIVETWEKRQRNDLMKELYKDQIHDSYTKSKRRLRVGYMSSDFCNHPVARFLVPILETHDTSIIETWCIHTGNYWDETTEKVKLSCEHWLELTGCDDERAARVVADQRLDILVELGGFTGENRIAICLREPAYIQMSSLGYPGPTFLKSIPWWIGDKYLFHGLNKADRNSHKLACLEKGYMTLPCPTDCPKPRRLGNKRFKFGSLNNARKLTKETISLWSEILKECADSDLLLKSISFKHKKEAREIIKRFENYGIDGSRLVLLPFQDRFEDHLEAYNHIDVALDPIPYGGATTTAEALWMGVPVICVEGSSMASNLAASVMASANCAELITKNEKAYLKLAKSLYEKGPRETPERLEIVKTVRNSPLNQPRRVSKELEKIYASSVLAKEKDFSL